MKTEFTSAGFTDAPSIQNRLPGQKIMYIFTEIQYFRPKKLKNRNFSRNENVIWKPDPPFYFLEN